MEQNDLEAIKETVFEKPKAAPASKPKNAVKKEPKQAYVYLGPNIPGGILFTGSIYKQRPEHIKDLCAKIPYIENMFVEISQAPQFKNNLSHKGSGEQIMYSSIVSAIERGEFR